MKRLTIIGEQEEDLRVDDDTGKDQRALEEDRRPPSQYVENPE